MDWHVPITARTLKQSIPEMNPMTKLLQSTTADNETIYSKHLNFVAPGNPWLRPYSIMHKENLLALFINGQRVHNDSPLIKTAMERHCNILNKVSKIGLSLYAQDLGSEASCISLQQTLDCIAGEQERKEETGDEQTVACLRDFYQHLLECWHGSSASSLQLNEFTADNIAKVRKWNDDERYNCVPGGDYYGPHCTLKHGMRSVIQPLLENDVKKRIRLSQCVTSIRKDEHTNGKVVVVTDSGLQIIADYCVITIPINCLKAAISNDTSNGAHRGMLDPATLSMKKIRAIQNVQMGCYKKVFLTFDHIFWSTSEPFIGLVRNQSESDESLSCPIGNVLLLDNLWASKGIPCIEAILHGLAGEWATHKSDEEIQKVVLEFMMDTLAVTDGSNAHEIFNYCVDCNITRWEEDPYSLGAYSGMTVGASKNDVNELSRPEWNGSLLFAGEATNYQFQGGVYSALLSGTDTAKNILKFESQKQKLLSKASFKKTIISPVPPPANIRVQTAHKENKKVSYTKNIKVDQYQNFRVDSLVKRTNKQYPMQRFDGKSAAHMESKKQNRRSII